MHVEHGFHFRRIHVEAVHDDHVFLPLDDRAEAVFVHPGDVASVEPDAAVLAGPERPLGLVPTLPIALHDLRARDAQLPGFAERQLARAGLDIDDLDVGVYHRDADRTGLARGQLWRRVGHRRGFRQTVPFAQVASEGALPLVDDFDRARRAAGVERAHVLEAEFLHAGMIEERDEHRRHRRKVGRPVLLDGRQHLFDIVLGQQHLQGAHPDALHHADGEGVDVKVRDDEQVARLAALPRAVHERLGLDHIGEEVPVREHRALRRAGGAACVLQDRQIVGRDRHTDHLRRLHAVGEIDEIGEGHGALHAWRSGGGRCVLRERGHDDPLEAGPVADAERERRQRVERDEKPHARIGRDHQHFARRIGRVDVDDNRAVAEHRERGDDVLRAVGQHDAHAVALREAESRQSRREPIGSILQLPKRQRGAKKGRGLMVGHVDGGRVQNVVERPPRVRHVMRHPVVVVVQPGSGGVG